MAESEEFYEDSMIPDTGLQGDAVSGRENVIKQIFNTEPSIEHMIRAWRGEIPVYKNNKISWKKIPGRELAGDRFLHKVLTNFSSIINDSNSITRKTHDELKQILHDAVKAFLYDAAHDPTVKHENIRNMSKSFEHKVELFLGLAEGGHGANVFRDSLAGINTKNDNTQPEKRSIRDWLNNNM